MLRKQISTTFSEPFLKENDSILDRIRIFQKRGLKLRHLQTTAIVLS